MVWAHHKIIWTGQDGTVQGGRQRGRQRKRWEDNIKEWTGLEWDIILRKVKNRKEWRKLVVKSTVVPQRSARLWDRWRWRSAISCYMEGAKLTSIGRCLSSRSTCSLTKLASPESDESASKCALQSKDTRVWVTNTSNLNLPSFLCDWDYRTWLHWAWQYISMLHLPGVWLYFDMIICHNNVPWGPF